MQGKIVFDALHKLREVTAQGLTPTCMVTVSKGTVARPQVIRRQRLLGSLQPNMGNAEYRVLSVNCLRGYHHGHPDYRPTWLREVTETRIHILAIMARRLSSEWRSKYMQGGDGGGSLLSNSAQEFNPLNHLQKSGGGGKWRAKKLLGGWCSSSLEKLRQL